jgi:hypothetical protein
MNGVGDKPTANASNKRSIEINDDANLGIAMLIAEFADANYQPVAAVVSVKEARVIAATDMRARTRDLECGGEPACPERYVVWAQGPTAATAR